MLSRQSGMIPMGLIHPGTLVNPRKRKLEFLTREYLDSYPGRNELAPNLGLHGRLRRILNRKQNFDGEQIDWLFNEVTYRLSILHQADDVTRDMGLQVDSIFNFCIETWNSTYLQRQLPSRS